MSDPGDDLLSIGEVCHFFGGAERPVHQSTIYAWVRAGKLPQPIRISRLTLRWKRSELQAVLDDMAAKRAAKGGV